jgi:hypothetical protein
MDTGHTDRNDRPMRVGPTDHVEMFWHAPGFASDTTYVLFRPFTETRCYLAYRYREFEVLSRRQPDPAMITAQQTGGGWVPEHGDSAADIVTGCIKALYENGFGRDRDDRAVYSIASVTTLFVDGTRDVLRSLLTEINIPHADWSFLV